MILRLAKLTLGILCGLLLLAAAAAVWYVFGQRTLPQEVTDVTIPAGSGVREIGSLLHEQGVVGSGRAFAFYVRMRGLSGAIEAGQYTFRARETLPEVVDTLARGGRPPAVWVAFPEGFTASQIAQRLQDLHLASVTDFMRAVRGTSLTLDGVRTAGLEGYLYPETYLIPRQTSATSVIQMMTAEFVKRLPADHRLAARKLRYTVPQIITIASIVEREAKVNDERDLIAGVIYNRLRLRMPLQVDATIEYALPAHKTELSFADLKVDSPYNTYTHAGLPPTPIANPGGGSIAAAFHPRKTGYLYYVYRGGGRHQFSRTLQDQQAAERRYLR